MLAGLAGGDMNQALAGGLAPYLALAVKKAAGDNDAANITGHALAGAVVAYLQGGSIAGGAAGAAGGELAAKIIAAQLYPNRDPSTLTNDEKSNISALSTLAAGLAGGVAGNSLNAAGTGAVNGKTTVENNALSLSDNKSRAEEMAQCQGRAACEKGVIEKYNKINADQHKSVIECKGAQNCVDKANEAGNLLADYEKRTSELLEKGRNGGLSAAQQYELSMLQGSIIQLQADRLAAIHNALMSGDSAEAKQLAINSIAQAGAGAAAGIGVGIGKTGAKGTSATGQSSTIVPGGGLAAHEKAGGHLIERHVGLSDAELSARLSSEPNLKVTSTFNDRATAESAVSKAIDSNQSSINNFMLSSGNQIVIKYSSKTPVGSSMTRGDTVSLPASNVTVVIRKDSTMPNGYKIITGYPTP